MAKSCSCGPQKTYLSAKPLVANQYWTTTHHLRHLANEWVPHDTAGRPHLALGPGIPQPPPGLSVPLHGHRHRMPPAHLRVVARPILARLHHCWGLLGGTAPMLITSLLAWSHDPMALAYYLTAAAAVSVGVLPSRRDTAQVALELGYG
jgi:hypothetical protein